MGQLAQPRFTKRYKIVTDEKAGGATYTPRILASLWRDRSLMQRVRIYSRASFAFSIPQSGTANYS